MAHIFSLNRSSGGVPKLPVHEARATVNGMEGDNQNDKVYHGGPLRALSLYTLEHILALQDEGHPIFPGSTGENVTLVGLDWSEIEPGTRMRLGEVEIEITAFAVPCQKIADSFSNKRFVRIGEHVRPGWSRMYARVVTEGLLRIGMPVEIVPVLLPVEG